MPVLFANYYVEVAFRLLLAVVLSGAIGRERESHHRPAGFRTHILVCVGAAVAALISDYLVNVAGSGADITRIAAQVVSGIGFLGAGTILREGATIKGLTTAASLWATACVGLAAGLGAYYIAVLGSVLVIATLMLLVRFDRPSKRAREYTLHIVANDRDDQAGRVEDALFSAGAKIERMRLARPDAASGTVELQLAIRTDKSASVSAICDRIGCVDGVHSVDIA